MHHIPAHRRILVIDDNPAIHEDFRKILGATPGASEALTASEAALFGTAPAESAALSFEIDSALQGQEGVDLARTARELGRPYAMAFVDARMPPGLDGIETAARLWECNPDMHIVICTAYSDYSWQDIRRKLVHAERLVILKKPFDTIEVLQLADALTEKWRLGQQDSLRLQALEHDIRERNRDLEAAQKINALLGETNRQLTSTQGGEQNCSALQPERRAMLLRGLEEALAAEELTIHYQPLVDIATRRVVSLEALLRWHHPDLGPVSPAEFIPLAEESGLILPIGEFVLRAVCNQVVQWQRQGVAVVPVAVNLSPLQLERQDVWQCVRTILRETGMAPQLLSLELTESTLMKNLQRHAPMLQGLRGDGVRIQIDDFGTGYSSLSYLQQLPVDALKIDRSFIARLGDCSANEAIVGAILAMAHSLGLGVVAEGVETAAQLEVLGRHGCQVAQGYYFCRPVPPAECAQLLTDLAGRPSFTDTLRMRLVASTNKPRQLRLVREQSA
jgi:EAL domain-containing protein (putative c-di-GMP-specific phosphodiesterase class I)/DNA-binding NarL/FixJ family response regulator